MKETQETRVPSLGLEDPQEKEMATHSSILAWKTPWTEKSSSPRGCKELDMTERLSTQTHIIQAYTHLMAEVQAHQLHECTHLHKCDSYINSPLYLILLSQNER